MSANQRSPDRASQRGTGTRRENKKGRQGMRETRETKTQNTIWSTTWHKVIYQCAYLYIPESHMLCQAFCKAIPGLSYSRHTPTPPIYKREILLFVAEKDFFAKKSFSATNSSISLLLFLGAGKR